jgi:dipeptidyl-peptidase-4
MRAAMQRSSALRIVSFAVPLVLASLVRAGPQGARADYERAAGLGARFAGAVRNARVDVHWLDGAPKLWFADERFEGAARWRLFDAERGTNEAVFDERFEAAARAKGWDPAPARVHALAPDEFGARLGEHDVRWSRTSGELVLASAAPRASDLGVDFGPSEDGEECVVTFVNEGAAAVELLWIDGRGRRRSYGPLEPGGERTQRTFDGHNWLVRDAQGRELGAARARLGVERIRIADLDLDIDRGALRPERSARRAPGRSPDERWTVAVRERDLHLVDADGGERRLTHEGSEAEAWSGPIQWAPNSTHFVAWRRRPGGDRRVHYVESAPRDSAQPKLHSYAYLKPGDELPQAFPHLFEAASGREIAFSSELHAEPWSIERLEWESDSSAFSFLYNERGHRVLRVLRVEVPSGALKAVVDERCETFFDYAHKTFLQRVAGGRELLWMSERSGWNHLYRIDARSGEVLGAVTAGEWVVRGVESTNDERRELVLRVSGRRADEDPYHEHFVRVSYDGGEPVALTEADGTHELAFSPDGRFYVDRWSRVDHAPVSELRRTADGKLVGELARADATALEARGWSAPQRFVAKGRDGVTDIWGVVFRPTNFDPRRKYALVEQIYAGPHGAHAPKRFAAHHGHPQELAELGFVVVQLDGMGTNWRSKRFHDVAWKNLADAGFPDRIAWMKALAAAHPEIDLTRVGIYGGSAGGQNALRALLDHGDFYGAAVADCGCHDNRMDKVWWNELWMSWPVGPHYEESSNVAHAHRLKGDLLLIVGEGDENVDPASTLQVVNALIRADKDFELLVMPGVGHGAGGTPYGWRRTCDFLLRKLYGVEPRRP